MFIAINKIVVGSKSDFKNADLSMFFSVKILFFTIWEGKDFSNNFGYLSFKRFAIGQILPIFE